MWEESLEDHPTAIQRQKQQSTELIKESYSRLIDRKIEDELKLNKSSFRVMMAPERSPTQGLGDRKYSQHKPNYYDSLNRELQTQD